MDDEDDGGHNRWKQHPLLISTEITPSEFTFIEHCCQCRRHNSMSNIINSTDYKGPSQVTQQEWFWNTPDNDNLIINQAFSCPFPETLKRDINITCAKGPTSHKKHSSDASNPTAAPVFIDLTSSPCSAAPCLRDVVNEWLPSKDDYSGTTTKSPVPVKSSPEPSPKRPRWTFQRSNSIESPISDSVLSHDNDELDDNIAFRIKNLQNALSRNPLTRSTKPSAMADSAGDSSRHQSDSSYLKARLLRSRHLTGPHASSLSYLRRSPVLDWVCSETEDEDEKTRPERKERMTRLHKLSPPGVRVHKLLPLLSRATKQRTRAASVQIVDLLPGQDRTNLFVRVKCHTETDELVDWHTAIQEFPLEILNFFFKREVALMQSNPRYMAGDVNNNLAITRVASENDVRKSQPLHCATARAANCQRLIQTCSTSSTSCDTFTEDAAKEKATIGHTSLPDPTVVPKIENHYYQGASFYITVSDFLPRGSDLASILQSATSIPTKQPDGS